MSSADFDLSEELFQWFMATVPTPAIPHQVRASDFGHAASLIIESKQARPLQKQSSKKLALVLDLDMTLVHALQLSAFTPKFEPAFLGCVKFSKDNSTAQDNPQIFLLHLDEQPYVIKLRPGVRAFLRELAPLFELSIFTKATRPYLDFLLATLDPNRDIFGVAVSRDDAPELDIDTKVLAIVSDRPMSEIVVFDDRTTVWRECAQNVVRAEPYIFLDKKMGSLAAAVNNRTHLCEDNDRQLLAITETLKTVHFEYIQRLNATGSADVRDILKEVRSRVLRGCKLMFSGVPKDELPSFVSDVAMLGGECSLDEEVGEDTTHLLVAGGGKNNTKKVYEAKKFGKIMILHASWLIHALSTWSRPEEALFELSLFHYDNEGKVVSEVDSWEVCKKN